MAAARSPVPAMTALMRHATPLIHTPARRLAAVPLTPLPPPQSTSSTPQQVRHSSHSPLGAALTNPRKPVSLQTLRAMYARGEPISMITAHDFPSAHVADHAGMDMVLVGDSLAMVALGMQDTSEVTMDEMLLHCRSVARATKSAFTVSHQNFFLPIAVHSPVHPSSSLGYMMLTPPCP